MTGACRRARRGRPAPSPPGCGRSPASGVGTFMYGFYYQFNNLRFKRNKTHVVPVCLKPVGSCLFQVKP